LDNVDIDYSDPDKSAPLVFDFADSKADDTMLTVTNGDINFNNQPLTANAALKNAQKLYDILEDGGTIQLMDEGSGGSVTDLAATNLTFSDGAEQYSYTIDSTYNARLTGSTGPNSYKPYFEGAASAVLTVAESVRGADTVISRLATVLPIDNFHIQLGFYGGSFKNKTGSSVKLNQYGFSLAGGRKIDTGAGTLVFGAFLEGGSGSYDTVNSYALFGDVYGEGDTHYFGGGLFVRHDFTAGTWVSFAARYGSVRNDFKLKDWAYDVSYKVHSPYYGFSLAAGHPFRISDAASIELYGMVSLTTVKGKSVRDSTGGVIHFDAVNATRTRLGGRLNYDFTESVTGFFGLAWEHDFGGKAGGAYTSAGGAVSRPDSPDFSGSSAYGELGVKINASENVAFEIEAFGLAGQNKGGGATAMLVVTF
jgi:outer membrane autotransporter protein